MSQYIKKRKGFYSNYPHFWSDLYECEYSLFHVFPITEQTMKQLQLATERMGKIFFKTARLLRDLSNEQLLELGFPDASLPFIRLKGMYPESVISRFDFALTDDNRIKMLEFNSDTPTFIVECFQMNGKVCEKLGYDDPNANQERLLSSGITKAVMEFTKGMEDPNVVFTAHHEHIEDWNTTMYLSGLCHVENKVMPMTELRITDDALVDRDGVPIDVLYRQTYPIEDLIEDQDPETGGFGGSRTFATCKRRKAFYYKSFVGLFNSAEINSMSYLGISRRRCFLHK